MSVTQHIDNMSAIIRPYCSSDLEANNYIWIYIDLINIHKLPHDLIIQHIDKVMDFYNTQPPSKHASLFRGSGYDTSVLAKTILNN